MHVDIKPTIILHLTAEEFSLVTRSLSGCLKSDEVSKAVLLSKDLCNSRHNRNNEQAEVSAKALAAVDKIAGEVERVTARP